MAGFLSKSQELLRLIPDLQCHGCKSVPGPKDNQKNRYSCMDSSHILCEEHKVECPCGSKVKNFIKSVFHWGFFGRVQTILIRIKSGLELHKYVARVLKVHGTH